MYPITLALALPFSFSVAAACPDAGHTHQYALRAEPRTSLTLPSRPLVWGNVNIIHTTDSHGWLLGHQKPSFPEPNYRCVSHRRILITTNDAFQVVILATLRHS
jgi:2',3'-cyclic-nucleotide 2'-phosphodiesterase (5'-nucleotidase family)